MLLLEGSGAVGRGGQRVCVTARRVTAATPRCDSDKTMRHRASGGIVSGGIVPPPPIVSPHPRTGIMSADAVQQGLRRALRSERKASSERGAVLFLCSQARHNSNPAPPVRLRNGPS